MSDITQTAIQDCLAKKRELAVEVDRLRAALAKAEEQTMQWEKVCAEVHDARMRLTDAMCASQERMESMKLWAHLRMWWHSESPLARNGKR